MYRAPAGSIKNFMMELKNALEIMSVKKGMYEHIVMGDFNIDMGHKEKLHIKGLRDLFTDYGTRHLETNPTRITVRSRSTLDLIFSDMEHIMDHGVMNVDISDHLPVYVVKKKECTIKKKEMVRCRPMWNYDIEIMDRLIRSSGRWHDFWKCDVTVDDLWEIMYNTFLDALNFLCPIMNKYVQVNKPNWVTKEVREAISVKNNLYNMAKRTGTDGDWAVFRKEKKSTSKLINDTKCRVLKHRLKENKGNPKFFLRHVNQDILGKGDKGGIEVIRDEMGSLIAGTVAADFANRVYADMGKDGSNGQSHWTESTMNMNRVDSDFMFKFVELLEVHQLIMGIDVYKACGVEDISTKVLKDCLLICEFELTYLINCPLYNASFPKAWKNSIITPIHKSGDKLQIENWRPINNLCVPGKLLEKCVYRQVVEYMEKNNFICRNQHGFRRGKGTDTAVMELVRKLFDDINGNNVLSILFLDYSRAFNTVDPLHQIRRYPAPYISKAGQKATPSYILQPFIPHCFPLQSPYINSRPFISSPHYFYSSPIRFRICPTPAQPTSILTRIVFPADQQPILNDQFYVEEMPEEIVIVVKLIYSDRTHST